MPNKTPTLEALEPRLMLSADLVPQWNFDPGTTLLGLVGQETVIFQDGADNVFVTGYTGTHDNQILNYGTWQTANVGARNTFQTGTGLPGGIRRPILRFTGLDVMGGAYTSIDSARIVLKKAASPDFLNGPITDMDMHAITNANAGWIEGNGVFAPAAVGESAWDFHDYVDDGTGVNNGWAAGPGPFEDGDMMGGGAIPLDTVQAGAEQPLYTEYSFDIPVALVEQWITGGPNAGVIVKIRDEVNVGAAIQMHTSEFGDFVADAARHPLLEITYTPSAPTFLLGDANIDNVVSADDYASVQSNFGSTGAPGGGLEGDANHDGAVSADDYASVQSNFGSTLAVGQIPEPATIGLLVLGGLAMLRRRSAQVLRRRK